MKRTAILESGEELQLECNAATPIIHKRLWKENIMTGFQQISQDNTDEMLAFIQRVTYTFAKTAEYGTKDVLNHENTEIDYIDFLSKFEILELATGNILDIIMEMWGANVETSSEAKNQASLQQESQP